MDSKDRQIIAAPQASGRMSDQALAERVSLSPSPRLRRLRQLEETRVKAAPRSRTSVPAAFP